MTAQEGRDGGFAGWFCGYDEWQVDLHLDRVERQLGELEERGGFVPARGPERIGPGPGREERVLPAGRGGREGPPADARGADAAADARRPADASAATHAAADAWPAADA